MVERKATERPRPIQLGLQGGGAHGALAWGVLDRLLVDDAVDIRGVSGTSAGAMNAVILADGLARGGRDGAREALATFWRSVADAGALSPFRRGLWDRFAGRHSLDLSPSYLMFDAIGRLLSPQTMNPFGINPLKDLLRHVDFDRLNGPDAIDVHVAATELSTGRARVFSRGALSAEAVLASASLPQLHGAVEIDGELYWDGGFSANPALAPLIEAPAAPDILIVALNPMQPRAAPVRARDIINRLNEITFNASLLNQLEAIGALQHRHPDAGLRLHLVEAGAASEDLVASSKFDVEWQSLRLLFERGRQSADAWLAEHGGAIGVRQTFEPAAGVLPAGAEASPEPPLRRALQAIRGWLAAARDGLRFTRRSRG